MNILSFISVDGSLDWEVHWEPRVHTWSMLLRICTVKYVLVKFSSEVSTESVYLSLFLCYSENNLVKFFHTCFFSLAILLDFLHNSVIFWLRIRNVSKSEDFFCLIAAREIS